MIKYHFDLSLLSLSDVKRYTFRIVQKFSFKHQCIGYDDYDPPWARCSS